MNCDTECTSILAEISCPSNKRNIYYSFYECYVMNEIKNIQSCYSTIGCIFLASYLDGKRGG